MLLGNAVPVVDCIIGGSPCQGLSCAGLRRGLADERSGLFMEQIRVIKEMRNADIQQGRTGVFARPRFMVWENVVGAFSSNKGEDFRAVLEETIRIAEPNAPDIPLPAKGKWPLADAWYGDGWSVAYRVLDAQFWGTPQRRRRIALVADFGGHAAPEILFVRKGVCGNIKESRKPEEGTPAGAEGSAYQASAFRIGAYYSAGMLSENPRAGIIPVEKACTLDCNGGAPTSQQGGVCILQPVACSGFKHKAGDKAGNIGFEPEFAPTLLAEQQLAVYDARGNGDGKTVFALTGSHEDRITDYTTIVMSTGQANAEILRDKAPTLNCDHEQPIVVAGIDCRNLRENDDLCGTLQAKENGGYSLNYIHPVRVGKTVRRLTPLECERLQGYPDGWTDIGPWTDSAGKLHKESSDSARYTALGNSIALPPWTWVLKRLCACYERPATMASLFDGIGGFPLIWERLNGTGSCLWASEIEEFAIAVTKFHFCRSDIKPSHS